MTNSAQHRGWTLNVNSWLATAALALAIAIALALAVTQSAQAQTFTVLHTFSGGSDGAHPEVGLTMDRAGNLYGTTTDGGSTFQGTVFKLARKSGAWTFQTLYSFKGGTDGANPQGRVAIGPDGTLYGTTTIGGIPSCDPPYNQGCGTIFNLRPPAAACQAALCPWTETVLYRFTGINDGGGPQGDLVFDQQGNLYGSAGNIYELSPGSGGWTLSVLTSDVYSPGLIFDKAGNLYGAYPDPGAIFQLMPSSPGWVLNFLYKLNENDDGYNLTGLIFDQAGNLYGGAANGGPHNGGTVFEFSPSNGGWSFNLLYAFTGDGFGGPFLGTLLMDPAGNLYGATDLEGMHNVGSVFELTPSNGGWTYTDLHDFHGLGSDGCYPNNGLVRDANGNLYGSTDACGSGNPGNGVLFEITP